MMADLIPAARRPDAYSLLRMSNNLGISVGPAVGGFIASVSYSIAFSFAALGLFIYGVMIAILAVETLPKREPGSPPPAAEPFGGYGRALANRPFIGMVGAFALVQVCASLIWVLLAVYSKTYYGVNESQYGWIPTTNAVMVVLFQIMVTQVTKRFPPLKVLAIGAFFYGIANLTVAFGAGFWSFWVSMVIMTIGELILVPTSSTYAANLAPADQRARYMSLYGLTWSAAAGVGPIFGGFLSDQIGPKAIWYGGSLAGLASLAGFLLLELYLKRRRPVAEISAIPPV
jgi:MFS family permease